jgi:phage shock protein A
MRPQAGRPDAKKKPWHDEDMGLFDRMSRVASANFNALIAKLEDPKKEVEQTIREMDEQLKLARREIVSAVASEDLARKKVSELDAEIERWSSRAELAVSHGDDDLAREALRQKRRVSGERDRAEDLRKAHSAEAATQRSELERMEQFVAETKGKRGLLAARVGQARAGGGAEALGARPGGGGAFDELRRMEDRVEGAEAAALAEREVNRALAPEPGPTGLGPAELEARFRALEASAGKAAAADDVDDELRAIKTRVRVAPK